MIAIRRATDADRVAIARLHEAAIRALGPEAYTAEEVDSWAAGILPANYPMQQQIYVAVEDDAVIAFGHYNDGEIAIRRATDADRVAIARLHEAAIRALGPEAYTAEEVDSWAAGILPANYPLDQQIYVAVEDDAVIAFGHYHDGEIAAVYVDPLHVRRGIGRLLMDKLEEVARAEGATSVHLNAALHSQGFYAACGYRVTMLTTYRTRGGLAIRVAVMEKSL